MNGLYIKEKSNCIHSNHLFESPFCYDLSVRRRVANLAFHILTLGIPLGIYRVTSFCHSRFTYKKEKSNLSESTAEIFRHNKEIKPYSIEGQKALSFSIKALKAYLSENTKDLTAGNTATLPMTNSNIEYLATYYNGTILPKLVSLMDVNKDNPWGNEVVTEAADECMKIAYAISNLTLDDLSPFNKKLADQGTKLSYEETLTSADFYLTDAFYYCTDIYHELRGIDSNKNAYLFYTKGTPQNRWNHLYNDFCNRVKMHVDETKLEKQSLNHYLWTRKDEGVKTFYKLPSLRPDTLFFKLSRNA